MLSAPSKKNSHRINTFSGVLASSGLAVPQVQTTQVVAVQVTGAASTVRVAGVAPSGLFPSPLLASTAAEREVQEQYTAEDREAARLKGAAFLALGIAPSLYAQSKLGKSKDGSK
ncbi:hypothetical protein EMIHUDRAFT_254784 [Emiliania huxleyi CCMP1516]|uniref:Uncharacterized protein n=2 Tax=Emiliania huxleyi TaxID=2903 RepID=A0A0D3JLK2_EMIH1|nr:hypothetical protein EMIHUDRAFT_254784 [Emiliania huxleyi CCMP1516]EOD24387.1 hypothetical protein EMIHUDRAFT_254784 [Emiliania huxleyi CCMP1516]|eukprot:XP_005776816.1 hypothetical protein EMIHUDRAFT_254784 [Emiliania huxleyi CCMP1516]